MNLYISRSSDTSSSSFAARYFSSCKNDLARSPFLCTLVSNSLLRLSFELSLENLFTSFSPNSSNVQSSLSLLDSNHLSASPCMNAYAMPLHFEPTHSLASATFLNVRNHSLGSFLPLYGASNRLKTTWSEPFIMSPILSPLKIHCPPGTIYTC